MGHYQSAQICLSGHVITSSTETSPELTAAFCDRCGSPTVAKCSHCQAAIRGFYSVPGVLTLREYVVPNFCHGCGVAYPWTEQRIRSAQELAAELDELSEEEKESLKNSISDLARETPNLDLAGMRYKKALKKMGKVGADALNGIMVNLLSEIAKKSIGL